MYCLLLDCAHFHTHIDRFPRVETHRMRVTYFMKKARVYIPRCHWFFHFLITRLKSHASTEAISDQSENNRWNKRVSTIDGKNWYWFRKGYSEKNTNLRKYSAICSLISLFVSSTGIS